MTIEEYEDKIKAQKMLYFELFASIMKADNGKLFHVDLFVQACLNRALQLSRSIAILIRNDAGIGAFSLARLHLDTLLRMWSAYNVENSSEHVSAIMEGKRIDKLKDHFGKLMTDQHLAQTYSESFNKPWVIEVYKKTSGFVHLSGEAIFQTIKTVTEPNSFTSSLSDEYILNDNEKKEIFGLFIEVNAGILELAIGWLQTKKIGHGESENI